jgi:single-strand DNA-binding protein
MLNQVNLIGTVSSQFEMKTSPKGTKYCNGRISIEKSYKDKQGSDRKIEQQIEISTFGKLADFASFNIRLGDMILIQGEISSYEYKTQDGMARFSTSVQAQTIKLMSPMGEALHHKNEDTYSPKRSEGNSIKTTSSVQSDLIEDDIPF